VPTLAQIYEDHAAACTRAAEQCGDPVFRDMLISLAFGGAGEVAAGTIEMVDEADLERIVTAGEHDRDRRGRRLGGASLGLTSTAIFAARGSSFSRSSSRFGSNSEVYKATPVALPPGRLTLVTRPSPIGLGPTMKRIGMVVVTSFAALADTVPLAATIRDTRRCTSSAASSGSRAN